MAFTGSEQMLKGFIMAELEKTLPNDETKPMTLKNMEATAEAIANAVVKWVLQAGANSVQANGTGTGTGTTAPGQAMVGAGGGVPGPMSGSTVSPGAVNTSVTTSVTGSLI